MLQKYNILKTAKVFFDEPTKSHYLIEISRKTKTAHTSVKNHLNILLKEKIIIKEIEKRGTRKFPLYRANINHSEYRKLKTVSNQILIQDLISYLSDTLLPKCIILFGSYSRGEDLETSDIDIYIQCTEKHINLEKYEKILKRKIQLHCRKNFDDFPAELKNNIINGLILCGYLQVYDN